MCLVTGLNIVLIEWHQIGVLEVFKGKKTLEKLKYEQDIVASNIGIVAIVQKGKRICFYLSMYMLIHEGQIFKDLCSNFVYCEQLLPLHMC